ncbi:MAG: T9SS type A sorting domain-containing protein, partial [Bacteroidota bacterium]
GLYTYVYKFNRIIENWDGQTYMQDIWYPCKPRDVEFGYSLYVYDGLATSVPHYPCAYLNGIKEMHSTTTNSLTLFPNPNAGELNLVIELADEEKVKIEVYDLSGRNVQTIEKGK